MQGLKQIQPDMKPIVLFFAGKLKKILNNLPRYRRQYYGIMFRGAKQLYVNFFPGINVVGQDSFPYWRDKFVFVADGGYWFWRIRYDLVTKKFFGFETNGYA